jgi:hypothetical protein
MAFAIRLTAPIFLLAVAACAQTSGEIRGYAWDADGKPVADATVTLHPDAPAKDRTVTAGPDGSFDARDLPPGHYSVTADSAKRQLTTETVTPLDLKLAATAHVDLTLGKSTVHYGFWTRLGRRLDGLSH